MEYYSATKRTEPLINIHNMDKSQEHHAKWKKPDTESMIPLTF